MKQSYAPRLSRETKLVVVSHCASPADVRRIFGLWSWALLLRRSVCSIIYQAFVFMNEPQPTRRRRIPDYVVDEIKMLLDIFQVLCENMGY